MTFAPDGHTLATGSWEGTVVWDVRDPARPQQLGSPLTGHTGSVDAVASPRTGTPWPPAAPTRR